MCLYYEKPQAVGRLEAVPKDTFLDRLFLGSLLLSSAASASPDEHIVPDRKIGASHRKRRRCARETESQTKNAKKIAKTWHGDPSPHCTIRGKFM